MSAAELARVASAFGDPTRAAVCTALLDGRAWTAGELARRTGVAASTMSAHLGRLLDVGLLTEHRQGRHRYVALAGTEVAATIELLLALGDTEPPKGSFRAVSAHTALRRGRTCYDHLAGHLGVALTHGLVGRGMLTDDLAATDAGQAWLLAEFGVDPAGPGRRPLTRACLDWTERTPHVAGRLGAAICDAAFARGWVVRVGDTRAVRTTAEGDTAMLRLFGVVPAEPRTS